MNEFVSAFTTELLAAIGALAGAVAAYYVRKGVNYFSKNSDLENKKELAVSVVRFVEQVYESTNGEEKFRVAKQRLIDLANENGLKITQKQVETFIEEAVRGLKDEFGEGWALRD